MTAPVKGAAARHQDAEKAMEVATKRPVVAAARLTSRVERAKPRSRTSHDLRRSAASEGLGTSAKRVPS